VPTAYRVEGGLSLADLYAAAATLARSEIVGLEIGELETISGEEDLAPLMDAVAPILDSVDR
jgi:arginase family enzyme